MGRFGLGGEVGMIQAGRIGALGGVNRNWLWIGLIDWTLGAGSAMLQDPSTSRSSAFSIGFRGRPGRFGGAMAGRAPCLSFWLSSGDRADVGK
jgi:hypothetical protein